MFSSINFWQIFYFIFNWSFNIILLNLWVEKQQTTIFFFLVNNRGFYISVNHSLWIDLWLTKMLLRVKKSALWFELF